jgi:hypothetical protein
MNKLLFPLALLLTLSACSQHPDQRSSGDESPSLDKFYNRFHTDDKEGGISIDPGFLLNAGFSGKDDDKDHSGWMHKVTHVRLLILDDKATPARQQEWSELSRSLRDDRFDELFTIRQGKDRVQLLSKERADGEKEVVFLAGDKEGGGLFIHFRGSFTAQDMEKIQSALQNKKKGQDKDSDMDKDNQ